jgi:transposase
VRLATEQRQLGLQVGGAVAARIAQRQGMPVSSATILRLVRRTRLAEPATPLLLGVDEWAYRKRLDFKTILVDLSTNQPLELLPDANATTFATWLQAHPGVTVIARDRAGTFAEGATQGAPDAVQVADRFHLMQNLRTAIEQILNRMVDVRQAAAEALTEQTTQLLPTAAAPDDHHSANEPFPLPEFRRVRDPYRKRVQEQRRAQRLARYEQVRALQQSGALQQEIAQRLHITRATVRRYLQADGFPERAPYPRLTSKLDPYTAYLTERWAAGEANGRHLWQELQAQASDFGELKSLAGGMARDYAAVEAALRLPYSTGPVEGNINRLKLIKRSGYGRASFDLLRLRALAT